MRVMVSKLNKLILASFRGGILSASVRNGVIVQLNFECGHSSLVGNLYAAKVKKIQRNLEAAFLDIGEALPAYYAYGFGPNPVYLDSAPHPALREGDEILVRIKKDAQKTKGPTAVSDFPERTDPEFIRRAAFRKAPGCIKRADPFWKKLAVEWSEELLNPCPREETAEKKSAQTGALAENADPEYEVITDIPEIYRELTGEDPEEAESYAKRLPTPFRRGPTLRKMQHSSLPVRFYADSDIPLSALWSLETAVKEATNRKVWLKSGGYLVIDPVEAMTVIDVNSGKNIRGGGKEQLIRKTDEEAAVEVMRQLRLRNLSGIVIVDFIDLRASEDRQLLLKQLRRLASLDPMKTTVVDITKLNLVEIIRQKSGKTLSDQLRSSL